MAIALPPLKGDGAGIYKVQVVGNSGAGKSTIAAELAKILGVPYIKVDKLFWNPGWKPSSDEDLRAKLGAVLAQCDGGWVVEGVQDIGSMIPDEATDIIWLDPPFLLYFMRLCIRTFLRLAGLRPSCAPGCSDTVREAFFSTDSIFWWCISHHWYVKRRQQERLQELGIQVGGKMRRVGGWGRELEVWMQSIREMCCQK